MKSQKHLFQLDDTTTYLNCAYMSPLMKSVEQAGIDGLIRKRNPLNVTPNDFFVGVELLQKEFAKLINVTDYKSIAVLPSTSYGLATVANNVTLEKGEKVIIVDEQFPSNYYTWEQLTQKNQGEIVTILPPDTIINRGKIWNERILEAIDTKTKVVAISHAHWADGTKFDLIAIRKRTKEVGALLIVDGTQSVGALPFDVQTIQPDALICSGYKWLMGPYSIALGYFGEVFENGNPIEESWLNRSGSENFANLVNYQSDYQPKAQRFQVGQSSNFINVPMMTEALRMLNHWGVDNIQNYCHQITTNATEQLQNNGFLIEDINFRSHHLIGIRLPKSMDIDLIKAKIAAAKITVSIRGTAIRIAPNVYNDVTDLEQLVKALS